jgi:hypothetical protein
MAIKRPDTPLATTPKPTYVNLGLARTATNNAAGRDTNAPATKKDSADYRKGYAMGLDGKKVSAIENKYQGKNQYVEKGRWEGQNVKKNDKTYFPTIKVKIGSNKKNK